MTALKEGTSGQSMGPSTDAANRPVIDPTENVMKLVEASSRRQDDLRAAERRFNDLRAEHQKEMADLRAEHQKELSAKESSRLDSIRQVDREDVAKTAQAANLAITTLAKQTADLASTLQTQVQATAAAAETRRTADMGEIGKRVSALELGSSAQAGKQQVADPQMDMLVKQVAQLAALQQSGAGQKQGFNAAWAALLGVFSLIVMGLAIYAAVKP